MSTEFFLFLVSTPILTTWNQTGHQTHAPFISTSAKPCSCSECTHQCKRLRVTWRDVRPTWRRSAEILAAASNWPRLNQRQHRPIPGTLTPLPNRRDRARDDGLTDYFNTSTERWKNRKRWKSIDGIRRQKAWAPRACFCLERWRKSSRIRRWSGASTTSCARLVKWH